MFKANDPRQPNEQHTPLPHDEPYELPHLHGSGPLPPHLRASKVRLSYNEEIITKLETLYDDVDYLAELLAVSPPEIKLTVAMALGIKVDLSEYSCENPHLVRFTTPFLHEQNSTRIRKALNCDEDDVAISLYNACPPEIALLALAVATLKETGEEV